ncbi:MAG: SUMF1/EgtB/PvdO family nonheme iron enzyme [Verrucomicrobiota bacterium]
MEFVPVPISGGPDAGQPLLFSIWPTRVQDYRKYAGASAGVDGSWQKTGFRQGDAHPVVRVSWQDAVAFCEWLTRVERGAGGIPPAATYRLPTDHEWSCAVGIGQREHAAETPLSKDGKLVDDFPWGSGWPPPAGAGNYEGKLQADPYPHTSPVGSFAPNPAGIFDLGGNVWEWCEDRYCADEPWRVLRGASWNDAGRLYLTCCCRIGNQPSMRNTDSGFRCVLALPPSRRRCRPLGGHLSVTGT